MTAIIAGINTMESEIGYVSANTNSSSISPEKTFTPIHIPGMSKEKDTPHAKINIFFVIPARTGFR